MKHLLLTTIAAMVLVGCGSVFVVHASTQNERSKAKAANVHVASSTFIATVKKDLKYINYTLFVILSLIAFVIYVIYKLDSGRPLREAAEKGNIEAVKQHIAAGVKVNAMDGFSRATPLYLAAHNGHKEIVELLITQGADVNVKNSFSRETPLHNAAYDGHKEIIELLIAKGADVNAINGDGETPLDYATEEKQKETADLLRKHGGKTGEELKAKGK
jgi:ankyrin repeat protein